MRKKEDPSVYTVGIVDGSSPSAFSLSVENELKKISFALSATLQRIKELEDKVESKE